jgi:ribosomal protein S27AE
MKRTLMARAAIGASLPFEFECGYCGWTGTDPTTDAHLNPWCPKCGKPAEFAEIARLRREKKR